MYLKNTEVDIHSLQFIIKVLNLLGALLFLVSAILAFLVPVPVPAPEKLNQV